MGSSQSQSHMSVKRSNSFGEDRQKRYHQMKKSSSLTDCVINFGGKGDGGISIKCHRMVLSAASPYFDTMFSSSSKMVENRTGRVVLETLDPSAVASLIDYCYLGELDVPLAKTKEYLEAAHHLQLMELMENFDSFITENIEPRNCIGFMFVAERYELKSAQKKAEEITITRLKEVSKLEEFHQLEFKEVTDVIRKSIEQGVESETVLQACIDWAFRTTEDLAL